MDESPYRSRQELLTEQFYEWEKRGRGWQLWDAPVQLEPPFRPFLYHWMPPTGQIDDARRLTFVGSIIQELKSHFRGSGGGGATESVEIDESDDAAPIDGNDSDLVELAIALPQNQVVTKDSAEQFLLGLNYATAPIALEVIGLAHQITMQLVCRLPDANRLRQQIQAFFPEAVAIEQKGHLEQYWQSENSVVVDFGLSNEFMLPLRTFSGFAIDPLIAIVGALGALEKGEIGVFQMLFQPVRNPWADSIIRAVSDGDGKSFFANSPNMLKLAREKVSKPLFATVIRVAASSDDQDRSLEIAKAIGGALKQFSSPDCNELIPLSNDQYPEDLHSQDLLARKSRRSGMILNCDELVSLAHFPSSSVRSEKLKRDERRTKAAPALALGHQTIIGENQHNGITTEISLSAAQRIQHSYIIGASGTGKSTLLLNMIIQDIQNGAGFGVLDPHGDLIDKILGYIPEERHGDVILFDPSDEEYPIGFNILSAHSDQEKTQLSSDLVAGFRRLSTTWGDQMTSVLGNAILAMLESEKGGTLADLRRFLVEREFRQAFLQSVKDHKLNCLCSLLFLFLLSP